MRKLKLLIFLLLFFLVGCGKKYVITGENEVFINEEITLSINIEDENITWESDNPSIATVENGVIRGINEGNVIISVLLNNENIATHLVMVVSPASLTVTAENIIAINDYAIINVESNQLLDQFTFESLNEDIASVDENGKVTGISIGKTTILITSEQRGYHELNIEIVEHYTPNSIEIINDLDKYLIGETYQLKATATPLKSLQEFTWEVIGDKAIISNDNEITFNDVGEIYVICRSAINQNVAKVTYFNVVYPDDVDVMNILFLGNSHTYYNDVPGIVEGLGKANGMAINCTSFTEGGATINSLILKYKTKIIEELNSTNYDYIIIQEQSTSNFRNYESFLTSAKEILKIADGVEVRLYQTWAYEEGSQLLNDYGLTHDEMYQNIVDSYHNVSAITGIKINPVGDVFEAFINQYPDIKLYTDGNHANRAGSYLSACVHYFSLFQESVVGNSYKGYVDDDLRLLIQEFVTNYFLK